MQMYSKNLLALFAVAAIVILFTASILTFVIICSAKFLLQPLPLWSTPLPEPLPPLDIAMSVEFHENNPMGISSDHFKTATWQFVARKDGATQLSQTQWLHWPTNQESQVWIQVIVWIQTFKWSVQTQKRNVEITQFDRSEMELMRS